MKRLLLFLAFLLTIQTISSQEESETVFTYNILEDLYLSLDGTWQFQIDSLYSGQLSDIIYNTTFSQTPDFSASLWLFNMFFFETEIVKDSDNSTFLLGYENRDTMLKEVRIGNDDLNIDEYAGYTPSINRDRAPGVRAKLSNDASTHEILVRYTSELSDTVYYRGYTSLEREELYISSYDRDHFFRLPGSYSYTTTLFTDVDGELTELHDDEYIIDSSGDITLLEDEYNSLYIISDDLTADEITTYSEYLSDKTGYLTLYQRGQYTPFVRQNVYPISLSGEDYSVRVNDDLYINYTVDDEYIIFNEDTPFSVLESDLYLEENYFEEYLTLMEIEVAETVSSITVPENAKENSLAVYINDRRYYNFNHNTSTGVVTFNRTISPLDEIVISYDMESDPGTANFLTSYGSSYRISENLQFEMSHTMDWNISDDDYTYTEFENSGSINSRGQLNYSGENLQVGLTTSINSFLPDTNGVFLLTDFGSTTSTLPFTGIELDNSDTDYEPLIVREYDDELVDIDEFKELPLSDDTGAYIISLTHFNSSNDVIVIETGELLTDQSSAVKLELEAYADDYSWVERFNITALTEVDRDIRLHFINSVTGDEIVKELNITTSTDFETFYLQFSDDEVSNMGYIDEIIIETDDISNEILFISSLSFEGIKDIKQTSTGERLYSDSSNLNITGDGGDITLEIPVNSVGLESYETLTLNLTESSFFTEDSEMTITLESRSETLKTYSISDPESGELSLSLPDSGYLETITITFTDTINGGTLKITPITLEDPVQTLSSKHKLTLTYTPEFTWEIGEFTIVKDLEIEFEDEMETTDNLSNSINTELSMNLLGVGVDTEVSYYSDEFALGYGIKLPENDSPVTLNEYYYYSDYRYRENSLVLQLPLLDTTLFVSDQIKDGERETKNEAQISLKFPFMDLESKTVIDQDRSDSLDSLSQDIFYSYTKLFISDRGYESNSIDQSLDLSLQTTHIDFETGVALGIDTQDDTTNSYDLSGKLTIKPGQFVISPSFDITYKLKDRENQSTMGEQLYLWYSDFTYDHPTNISIGSMFLGDSYDSFFEGSSDNRQLSSSLGLSLKHSLELDRITEIFVPSSMSITTNKLLLRDGSLNQATLTYGVNTAFNFSSILTNSVKLSLEDDLRDGDRTTEYTVETSFSRDTESNNRLIILHTLNYDDSIIKSGTELDYSWKGKSGPLYIVPILGNILDAPYSFEHEEQFYLTVTSDFSIFLTGFRHETIFTVLHRNEVEMFFDMAYDHSSQNRLYMEAGFYITLIF